MESQRLRSLLFDAFRGWKDDPLNVDECEKKVAERAHQRGHHDLLKPEKFPNRPKPDLTESAKTTLVNVLWDLILGRVLIPGNAAGGWPNLSITEHGKKVIEVEDKPTPYDPDGYLGRLSAESPNLHATIARYVQESVATFRTGNYLASVVMLGAAAEKLFVELTKVLPERLSTGKKGIAAKIKSVANYCYQNRKDLPSPWNTEDHADDINQVATFIRRRRNDAGHPKDPPAEPTTEQMYAWLMVFPDYCKHIYQLRDWAAADPKQVPP